MKKRFLTRAMTTALCFSLTMPVLMACGNSAADSAQTTEATEAAQTTKVEETEETTEAAKTTAAQETTEAADAAKTTAAEAADAAETTAAAETAEDYVIELDPQYNVPTDELLKSFPITYQTPAETELSQKIQNRMLNGFNRWNNHGICKVRRLRRAGCQSR